MTATGKRYGLVVVGCGGMARQHLKGIFADRALSERVQLVATVDWSPKQAALFARRYGAPLSGTDVRPYLERSDVDIVLIATYPSTHSELALACLHAGKHVLIEKPLAPTMAQARALAQAVGACDRKLLVGYVLRHNASYRRLKQLVEGGCLGRPIIMRLHGAEHTTSRDLWRRDTVLANETSPIIDCGCHYVDVMRWFTGAEAVRVSGIGARLHPEIKTYDYGMILVQFADGSVGSYEVAWQCNTRDFSTKEFIGPAGRLRLIYQSERGEHAEEGDLIELYASDRGYEIINVPGSVKRTAVQFRALLEMIETDADPSPALDDALKSLEIVLAGDEAIRTGRAVELPYPTTSVALPLLPAAPVLSREG